MILLRATKTDEAFALCTPILVTLERIVTEIDFMSGTESMFTRHANALIYTGNCFIDEIGLDVNSLEADPSISQRKCATLPGSMEMMTNVQNVCSSSSFNMFSTARAGSRFAMRDETCCDIPEHSQLEDSSIAMDKESAFYALRSLLKFSRELAIVTERTGGSGLARIMRRIKEVCT